MRTNYVLIDFESVQPEDLLLLEQDHFKVMVFVGASQGKVSFEVASALQKMGTNAEYVKISGNGPNALDFHIAYYIGKIAAADPSVYFHIISNDKGFDPLIAHLKTTKIFASRAKSVGEIPLVKVATSKSPQDRVEIVVAKLLQSNGSKPRTVKTLSSAIHSIFQKTLSDNDVSSVLASLQAQKHISVNGNKVTYSL